jgi:O-antigen ligase
VTDSAMGRVLLLVLLGVGLGLLIVLPEQATIGVAVGLAPAMVYVALRWPQAMLSLFLLSGSFKTALGSTLDLTIAFGVLVAVAIVVRIVQKGMRRPPFGMWAFLVFAAIVAASLVGGVNAYGFDKVARFETLSMLALLGGFVLLDTERDVERFMTVLVALGAFLSLVAIFTGGNPGLAGRFTALSSNTIQLGRVASFAAAGAVVALINRRDSWVWAVPTIVIGLLALAGSGSRGPALGLVVVASVLVLIHLTSAGAARTILATAVIVSIVVFSGVWAIIPPTATARFAKILAGDPGSSGTARLLLYAIAASIFLSHPLEGVGAGGFATYAGRYIYPHNAFLEVGAEYGIIGLVPYTIAVVSALWTSFRAALHRGSIANDFVFAGVSLALVNAMVSGDLNDNRVLYAFMGAAFVALSRRRAEARAAAETAEAAPASPGVAPTEVASPELPA